MNILLAAAICFVVGATDLPRAERQYKKARYRAALKSLGETCDEAEDVVRCERLRGFVHIALGDESSAQSSFRRMLEADPTSELGENISPKIQRIFSEARGFLEELSRTELRPLILSQDGTSLRLKVELLSDVSLVGVTAFLKFADQDAYAALALNFDEEEGIWTTRVDTPNGMVDPPPYYLALTLESGQEIISGSPKHPRVSTILTAQSVVEMAIPDGFGAVRSEPTLKREKRGMPKWAWWLIGVGAAIGVGTAVYLAVDSGDPPQGGLRVNVGFGDE